jgi:hypothetical protein
LRGLDGTPIPPRMGNTEVLLTVGDVKFDARRPDW